jgi:hypothetical protein
MALLVPMRHLLWAVVLIPSLAAPCQQPQRLVVPKTDNAATLRLQSGSHVALFLPEKAYLPARGHALTVEFKGTPGVMPRVQSDPGAPDEAARRVFYEELWPGISLWFTLSPKGVCEATFVLAPGADAARIRLHYNIPTKIQADGTIAFRFSSGPVTESSPEAWQSINGKRVAVSASYQLTDGEVGFAVGNYDHNVPLTIDPIYRAALVRSEDRLQTRVSERTLSRQ